MELANYSKIMEIELRGHARRKKKAKDFWLRVATDYNGGMSPSTISKRYINPKTQKSYTREHIYWVLRQVIHEPNN